MKVKLLKKIRKRYKWSYIDRHPLSTPLWMIYDNKWEISGGVTDSKTAALYMYKQVCPLWKLFAK